MGGGGDTSLKVLEQYFHFSVHFPPASISSHQINNSESTQKLSKFGVRSKRSIAIIPSHPHTKQEKVSFLFQAVFNGFKWFSIYISTIRKKKKDSRKVSQTYCFLYLYGFKNMKIAVTSLCFLLIQFLALPYQHPLPRKVFIWEGKIFFWMEFTEDLNKNPLLCIRIKQTHGLPCTDRSRIQLTTHWDRLHLQPNMFKLNWLQMRSSAEQPEKKTVRNALNKTGHKKIQKYARQLGERQECKFLLQKVLFWLASSSLVIVIIYSM